jgi:hypothetical protein
MAPRLRLLPIMAEWPAIERFLNEEIGAACFGVKSLDDAIATANRKANDELRRRAKPWRGLTLPQPTTS